MIFHIYDVVDDWWMCHAQTECSVIVTHVSRYGDLESVTIYDTFPLALPHMCVCKLPKEQINVRGFGPAQCYLLSD